MPHSANFDPRVLEGVSALADRQLLIDRERTQSFPDLFTHKLSRMSASPLAFLRGAAPLFFEVLRARPDLASGPEGQGWIVGDLHLENFGAYRSNDEDTSTAHFDLNDFDDAVIAPWRLDVVRLTTSLILGGRELGADGVLTLSLCDRLIDAWAKSVFDHHRLPSAPPPVRKLIEQIERRTHLQLLDGRTTVVRGERRFERGARYAELPRAIADEVPNALARYVASLPRSMQPRDDALKIKDVALRIAGTGSLGALRIAVLVSGKGGRDGNWIFDMKEEGEPSAIAFASDKMVSPAAVRVATAFNACVAHPPRMFGTTAIGVDGKDTSMIVRRLTPQEDKLNLRHIDGRDLPDLATYLGAIVGRAHVRGATKLPRDRWSKSDIRRIRESAITLAGLHEAIYLALCDRMSDTLQGSEKPKGFAQGKR